MTGLLPFFLAVGALAWCIWRVCWGAGELDRYDLAIVIGLCVLAWWGTVG